MARKRASLVSIPGGRREEEGEMGGEKYMNPKCRCKTREKKTIQLIYDM
jgi:hypothetical protein